TRRSSDLHRPVLPERAAVGRLAEQAPAPGRGRGGGGRAIPALPADDGTVSRRGPLGHYAPLRPPGPARAVPGGGGGDGRGADVAHTQDGEIRKSVKTSCATGALQ